MYNVVADGVVIYKGLELGVARTYARYAFNANPWLTVKVVNSASDTTAEKY